MNIHISIALLGYSYVIGFISNVILNIKMWQISKVDNKMKTMWLVPFQQDRKKSHKMEIQSKCFKS